MLIYIIEIPEYDTVLAQGVARGGHDTMTAASNGKYWMRYSVMVLINYRVGYNPYAPAGMWANDFVPFL